MKIRLSVILISICLSVFSIPLNAGIFDKAEYISRRAKLMAYIPDGVALILGSEGKKQNSNFIYFTGVETPSSILLINGKNKESILFFPSVESNESVIKEETGVDRVLPVSQLARQLASYQAQTDVIYTPFDRNDTGYVPKGLLDPDNRLSRELNFIDQIKKRIPFFRFKDISQAIGELRVIKSPAEIAVMRESARISSLAHIEVLRSAKSGMYEWELAKNMVAYMREKEGAVLAAFPEMNDEVAEEREWAELYRIEPDKEIRVHAAGVGPYSNHEYIDRIRGYMHNQD